jgi:hypothetical protein
MTDSITRVVLEERAVENKPLGRHIEHDPRSRAYAFGVSIAPLVNVKHKRHGAIFNQLKLGSCTTNAACGAKNSDPLFKKGDKILHEKEAVDFYKIATLLDGFPGSYPPDDTGSSGLAAAKALYNKGLIRAYHWAFGIDQALAALQVAPVITGIGWPEGFDDPNPDGIVLPTGQDRGGHEFVVRSYARDPQDPLDSIVGADNSWGYNWGLHGHFYFTVRTWAERLEIQVDVTVLVL